MRFDRLRARSVGSFPPAVLFELIHHDGAVADAMAAREEFPDFLSPGKKNFSQTLRRRPCWWEEECECGGERVRYCMPWCSPTEPWS